jgi:ankyrin repeat protein
MIDKNYQLQSAISKKDFSLVTEAVYLGADINHIDFNGCNSAHLAAISGSVEILKYIYISSGASILTAKNNFSLTPFSLAAIYKHKNLITCLIDELDYQVSDAELDFLKTQIDDYELRFIQSSILFSKITKKAKGGVQITDKAKLLSGSIKI